MLQRRALRHGVQVALINVQLGRALHLQVAHQLELDALAAAGQRGDRSESADFGQRDACLRTSRLPAHLEGRTSSAAQLSRSATRESGGASRPWLAAVLARARACLLSGPRSKAAAGLLLHASRPLLSHEVKAAACWPSRDACRRPHTGDVAEEGHSDPPSGRC